MDGGKSLYVIRFYEYSKCNYLVRKVSKKTLRGFLWTVGKVFMLYVFTNIASIKRFSMDGGKSLYVIRIYEYSEYNYPVRKVSKRTSRDFLWAIDEVFALSVFTDFGSETTL
ncbi:MAG: hypothetical protein BHW39_07865 [Firmicutes bacterium CAG:552_39_19]|nr:MAG: hypothetical protein BHW39_07865 [Firmicutes bacterium CAG:552_39_19]